MYLLEISIRYLKYFCVLFVLFVLFVYAVSFIAMLHLHLWWFYCLYMYICIDTCIKYIAFPPKPCMFDSLSNSSILISYKVFTVLSCVGDGAVVTTEWRCEAWLCQAHLLKVFILLQEASTDPSTTDNQNTVELGLWRVIRECRLFLQTYLLYLVVNLKLVNQTNIDWF